MTRLAGSWSLGFVLVACASATAEEVGVLHIESLHRRLVTKSYELARDATSYGTFELDPMDVECMRDGSEDEDASLRYRDHHFNPHTGDPSGVPFAVPAIDVAATRWAEMKAAFASPSNRWKGDGEGSFHFLGRVLHLSQDMTSPPHVHAPDGHGGVVTLYASDFEEYWADKNVPSFVGGPLRPSDGIPSSLAWNSRMDSESWTLMRSAVGSQPNDIRGYMRTLAWISYMHSSFYGEVKKSESNPLPSTTQEGKASIMRRMWEGRIAFYSSVLDDYWEIDGVGYFDAKDVFDDWWNCPGDLPYGSEDEFGFSSGQAYGRWYFYSMHNGGQACPERWPNDAVNSPQGTLAQYYGEVLLPLAARYGASLMYLAVPRADAYVDDGNTTGVEDGSTQNPFNTIQEGATAAANTGIVRVARGAYTGHLVIDGKCITIRGGYPGRASYPGTGNFSDASRDPDPATNQTVVDGNGTACQITCQGSGAKGSVLTGITIRDGGSTLRGGVVLKRVITRHQ